MMEVQIPLYERTAGGEERERGHITCTPQGMYVQFRVSCPTWEGCPAVCKIWLEQGERHVLLGTLMPEGRNLTLSRRLSAAELAGQGIERPERGVACAGEPVGRSPAQQWQGLASLPLHPQDPVLRDCLSQAPNAGQWKPEGDYILLRFPWRPGRPYPLLPVFCFGRVRDGAVYFCMNRQGVPVSSWPGTFAGSG